MTEQEYQALRSWNVLQPMPVSYYSLVLQLEVGRPYTAEETLTLISAANKRSCAEDGGCPEERTWGDVERTETADFWRGQR